MFVYVTGSCRANLPQELAGAFDTLCKGVESAQSVAYFRRFPHNFLKKEMGNRRLIAELRSVGGHEVLCLLDILMRGGNPYEALLQNRDNEQYLREHFSSLANSAEVQGVVDAKLKAQEIPENRPQPSDVESQLLYTLSGACFNEEMICESPLWVKTMSEKYWTTHLALIQQELLNFLNENPLSDSGELREIPCRDAFIVIKPFAHMNRWFLAGVYRNNDVDGRAEIYNILDELADDATEEDLLRRSRRAYASYIAIDHDMWTRIQQNAGDNLALSPEEVRILDAALSAVGGFPIFINGRAGSGKSTILYYLFAKCWAAWQDVRSNAESGHVVPPPILLSCSEALRESAKNTVSGLLKRNWDLAQEGQGAEAAQNIDGCFHELHTYLRSLLSEDDRTMRFPEDRYISHARFRKLWQEKFGANHAWKNMGLGADVCWHIIRTYVKGFDPVDYLDKDTYEELPDAEKSVSAEVYEKVFKSVWNDWYRPLTNARGWWDDQDLVREVFGKGLVASKYPGVFCDEAQDFTRMELEVVFRLSLFSDRTLVPDQAKRVPFVFAGDPFQTLNPTGFRWDAAKAIFHEKLTGTIGGHGRHNLELQYHELNWNYRSHEHIVRLCNSVQALRARLFRISDLSPQKAWEAAEATHLPHLFDWDRIEDWRTHLSDAKDAMIIVPCISGDEAEYVEAKNLKDVAFTDEITGHLANVYSPVRAKGLEFDRVVVYGFGDHLHGNLNRSFPDMLENTGADENHDTLLPLEYFVNMLYVALSRARKRLFIIDSPGGINALWRCFQEDAILQEIAAFQGPDSPWVDETIGGLEMGNGACWQGDAAEPRDLALQFESEGRAKQSPHFLRSAALYYMRCTEETTAARCRAEADKMEERFLDAGRHYVKAGMPQEALRCFWKDPLAASDDIVALAQRNPGLQEAIEVRLSGALVEKSPDVALEGIAALVSEAGADVALQARVRADRAFDYVYKELAKQFARGLGGVRPEDCESFVGYVAKLRHWGLAGVEEEEGRAHCRVGRDWKAALDCFQRANVSTNDSDYRLASKNYWGERFETERIVPEGAGAQVALFDAYCESREFLKAARLLVWIPANTLGTGVHGGGRTTPKLSDFLARLDLEGCAWWEIIHNVLMELADFSTRLRESDEEWQPKWNAILDIGWSALSRERRSAFRACHERLAKHSDLVAISLLSLMRSPPWPSRESASRVDEKFLDGICAYIGEVFRRVELRRLLDIRLIALLLEHNFRYAECRSWYGQLLADTDAHYDGATEIPFIRQRLVRCIEEQAKYESQDKVGHVEAAQRLAGEAMDRRHKWGFVGAYIAQSVDLQELIRLPKLFARPPLEESVPPQGSDLETPPPNEVELIHGNEFDLGAIRFVYDPKRGEVVLSKLASMVFVQLQERRFETRGDVFVQSGADGSHRIDEWGLVCKFSENDASATLDLRFDGEPVQFRKRFA